MVLIPGGNYVEINVGTGSPEGLGSIKFQYWVTTALTVLQEKS
jgi:hypothetical protein